MYCETPGHVAWQNGKRATPKERAELAAKVLKTIPTYCTSVETVQEKHSAVQLSTLQITAQKPSVEVRKKALVIQRAISQDCTHQGKEKGGVIPLGRKQ